MKDSVLDLCQLLKTTLILSSDTSHSFLVTLTYTELEPLTLWDTVICQLHSAMFLEVFQASLSTRPGISKQAQLEKSCLLSSTRLRWMVVHQ